MSTRSIACRYTADIQSENIMAAPAAVPSSNGIATSAGKFVPALIVLTSLFFMWGLITSLNDILIPHLKAAFSLSYLQASLIQFCFFSAYFFMSLPSGFVVERFGYKRGIIAGLGIAGCGCLLMYPAADAQVYGLFLFALFVLASGITLLQVAANPYVAILGRPERASFRLTLTQAFNSLGTVLGPRYGADLILTTVAVTTVTQVNRATEAASVQIPYLMLAAALVALAVMIGIVRLPVIQASSTLSDEPSHSVYVQHDSVWEYRHLVLGAVAIFMYVGAEVAIGSYLVNFMSQPDIAGLPEQTAGKSYLPWYWFGAMVGRFVGALVMMRIKPARVLTFNAIVAILLLIVAMVSGGPTAMYAVLAIGLFNSIMFPTIFTLAIDGLGKHTGRASGILCMAIVGGAVVPVVQGFMADKVTLLYSFAIPAVCYLYIVYYGAKGHYADSKRV
jgi:FHS family L-fucose permease-like MFS transporter